MVAFKPYLSSSLPGNTGSIGKFVVGLFGATAPEITYRGRKRPNEV